MTLLFTTLVALVPPLAVVGMIVTLVVVGVVLDASERPRNRP